MGVWQAYCGAQLRPQLSLFAIFAALPIIYTRCPEEVPAVVPVVSETYVAQRSPNSTLASYCLHPHHTDGSTTAQRRTRGRLQLNIIAGCDFVSPSD